MPRGSQYIRITGANSATPGDTVADAAQTLLFLRQNSPTLDKAVRTVVKNTGFIGIVPVPYATGGRADSNNAIYGVGLVTQQSNGQTVYPAYVLAHEIGQLYDFATGTTSSSGQSSLTMTPAQRALAPNVTELYAFNFANQVSAEIRANTGLNIGSPATYYGDKNYTIVPGPSYPPIK